MEGVVGLPGWGVSSELVLGSTWDVDGMGWGWHGEMETQVSGSGNTLRRDSFYVVVETTEMVEMAAFERDWLPEAWGDNEAVPDMGNLGRGQREEDTVRSGLHPG